MMAKLSGREAHILAGRSIDCRKDKYAELPQAVQRLALVPSEGGRQATTLLDTSSVE